jgi:galactose-1-phosphate uridylyltransferase
MMSIPRQITSKTLKKLLQVEDFQNLDQQEIINLFIQDENIQKYAPDGICQIDPRNGERVIFNSARANRPHDNRPAESAPSLKLEEQECIICQGKTTSVVDIAPLSKGFTFINKNLFPIFFPFQLHSDHYIDDGSTITDTKGIPTQGMHLIQWTSSFHDRDWQNMPVNDLMIVLQRLASLERTLINSFNGGYVSIIKNFGRLVGGSLIHGHQQICYSNVMPRKFHQNQVFQDREGETFSNFMIKRNPEDYQIRDYGPAVLLVPYFMRRPYDMLLLMKDQKKKYLHELNQDEIMAATLGWQDAIRAMLFIMPEIGREIAYNVTTNNGPGSGLYFEFLPYTQETGGFEHLGLSLCQGNPGNVAEQIREILSHDLDNHFFNKKIKYKRK